MPAHKMPPRRRSRREPRPDAAGLDPRVSDALTDLSTYALTLDVECHRLDHRLNELAQTESSAAERRALVRERDELAEELTALRGTITALSEQVPQRATLSR
jgi:hypothetical protein